MGTVLTILTVVLSVALSIGATHVADRIERDKAHSENKSPNQLLSTLYYSLDELKKKSRSAYNEALEKIESIPAVSAAGSLKTYLTKVKGEASKQYTKARDIAARVEDTVSGYQTEVMNYANQPDTYKNSAAGKSDYEQLVQKSKDLNSQVEQSIGG